MQEKEQNRSKPHFGHLNATEYRGSDAGAALTPLTAEAECRGGSRDEGEAEPAEGGGVALLVGSLVGQAQRLQWPHEEKRGDGRFGLMGFTSTGLPAAPPVVAQRSRPRSGFGQPIREIPC